MSNNWIDTLLDGESILLISLGITYGLIIAKSGNIIKWSWWIVLLTPIWFPLTLLILILLIGCIYNLIEWLKHLGHQS